MSELSIKFNVDDAYYYLKKDVEELKRQEKTKLKYLYDTTCSVCSINKKKNKNNDNNAIINFYNIKIKKNPNAVSNFYDHHIVCNLCVENINDKFTSKMKNVSLSDILDKMHKSLEFVVFCKLCSVEHSTFILPNSTSNNKNNNNNCCSGGCNIF